MTIGEAVVGKIIDKVIDAAWRFVGVGVSLAICTLSFAWVVDYMLRVPNVPHGLSSSELIGQTIRWVGYPNPHWMNVLSAWIERSWPHHAITTGWLGFAAAVFACFAGSSYGSGDKAALTAWAVFLVAVEVGGAHAAIHDTVVSLIVIFIIMGVFHMATRRPKPGTWRQAAGQTLLQLALIPGFPGVLALVAVNHLCDVWLLPTD
jgi:hypothetical protein